MLGGGGVRPQTIRCIHDISYDLVLLVSDNIGRESLAARVPFM